MVNRESGIGNRESGIGNRESGIGNRESGIGRKWRRKLRITLSTWCNIKLPTNIKFAFLLPIHHSPLTTLSLIHAIR
jgi:hypothetical protein